MEQSPSWEAERFSTSQEIPRIKEPAYSLPYLQVPATFSYPETDRSSPCPHIKLPDYPSYYYPPINVWVFQVTSFPQVSQPKPCIRLSPIVLHVLLHTLFSGTFNLRSFLNVNDKVSHPYKQKAKLYLYIS